MTDDKLMVFGIATLIAVTFNFIPTIIAWSRRHPDRKLIGQLNILSMVSFLLWFALLVWAVGGTRDDAVISRFVGRQGQRGRLVALVTVLVGAGIMTTAYAMSRP